MVALAENSHRGRCGGRSRRAGVSRGRKPKSRRGLSTPNLRPAEGHWYIDELILHINSGQKYYAHVNHLYSVEALTDSAGTVVERYRYDAYGAQKIYSGTGVARAASLFGQKSGFTGHVADSESGLAYARTRMYNPTLGRFLARDMWSSRNWSIDNPTYYHWLDAKWNMVTYHPQMTFAPSPMDGYVDGYNTYSGYFAPNGKDPYGLANCEQLIYLGHNDKVPQGTPATPTVPADPTGGCDGGCSAYAIYSCGPVGTSVPAVPSTWIPGADAQTPAGKSLAAGDAAKKAQAAYDAAVKNAPALCKGNCSCKSIHVEVKCVDPFSSQAGWFTPGWAVCDRKTDIPCKP